MKAASVHGCGDELAKISLRPGLRGQYGPCAPPLLGMATLSGRVGAVSSADIPNSSSSSALDPSVSAEGGYMEEALDELLDEAGDVK